jgi:hypothetical protein
VSVVLRVGRVVRLLRNDEGGAKGKEHSQKDKLCDLASAPERSITFINWVEMTGYECLVETTGLRCWAGGCGLEVKDKMA